MMLSSPLSSAMSLTLHTPPIDPIKSSFYLSPRYQAECDKYYLLYWEVEYLSKIITPIGTIKRQDVIFEVVFLNGLTIEQLRITPKQTVKLSFRRKRNSMLGYVLVNEIYTPCFVQSTVSPQSES